MVAFAIGFVFGGVIAACFASFLGVVTERHATGGNISGRSHCRCGRQLSAWENIPVFGWLSCRGRARCCGARIPARYMQSETVTLVLAGTLWGSALSSGAGSLWLTGAAAGTVLLLAGTWWWLTAAVRRDGAPACDTDPDGRRQHRS